MTDHAEPCLLIAADLGGTKLHVAIMDMASVMLADLIEPTTQRGADAVVAQIVALVLRLVDRLGVSRASLRYGAIGCPGIVDPVSGMVRSVPNVPGLDKIHLATRLKDELGVTFAVENDVNLAAVGEFHEGIRLPSFALLAIGTGIGVGIYSDGRLLRGATGAAGEIGLLPIAGDPFDSRNHIAGPLESAVGSFAMVQSYRAEGGRIDASVKDLIDSIDTDAAALRVVDNAARYLALSIAALASVVDPAVVVLGGSIGLRSEVGALIVQHLGRCMTVPTPVRASDLGHLAVLRGAARRAKEEA